MAKKTDKNPNERYVLESAISGDYRRCWAGKKAKSLELAAITQLSCKNGVKRVRVVDTWTRADMFERYR